jgi:hypothetical protein
VLYSGSARFELLSRHLLSSDLSDTAPGLGHGRFLTNPFHFMNGPSDESCSRNMSIGGIGSPDRRVPWADESARVKWKRAEVSRQIVWVQTVRPVPNPVAADIE